MIKSSFSRKINKINNKEGKMWQRRFYEECILNNIKLINKLDYMHNNPVRVNLVTVPEEYYYSSYNHYVKTDYSPKSLIEIDMPEL